VIRTDGTLVGWGYNEYGEINVPEGTFIGVAAGSMHSLAIRTDGTLAGWGCGGPFNYGQRSVPAGTFTAVGAGGYYGLAINSNATLIPTVSARGLIAMTVLVLGAGAVVLARRRAGTGPRCNSQLVARNS